MDRINELNSGQREKVDRTWGDRGLTISPSALSLLSRLHNGNKFIPIFITENMVGPQAWRVRSDQDFRGAQRQGLSRRRQQR